MKVKVPVVFCKASDNLSDYFFEIPEYPECSERGNSMVDLQSSVQKTVTEFIKNKLEQGEQLPKFLTLQECIEHSEFGCCAYWEEVEVDV